MKRRDFLAGVGGALAGASDATFTGAMADGREPGVQEETGGADRQCARDTPGTHAFCGPYRGECLSQIAFPVGGIGAGMLCVDGNGALSKFSFRHHPDLEREHTVFAAIAIKGQPHLARALQGPVPTWKLRPQFPGPDGGAGWGLPHFHEAVFEAQFPFATVNLGDAQMPIEAALTAWSPFAPGDADSASLPVAGLEYRFVNRGSTAVEAVFSFNAENMLAQPPKWPSDRGASKDRIRAMRGGFVLYGAGSDDRPWDEGSCAIWIDDPSVAVNHAWTLDSLDVVWRDFASGRNEAKEPLLTASAAGASLFVPFALAPGEAKTFTVFVAWYVPKSNLCEPIHGFRGGEMIFYPKPVGRYEPWYAGRFSGINELAEYWISHYAPLRQAAEAFSRTLFDSTLSPEVLEAVTANLSILKSPTVLRQKDGRLWGWEGCMMESAYDGTGVSGTTTHVWNYAQSIPHLFPALERTLRETEFGSNQNDEGLQYSRTPLPIRPVEPGHTVGDGPAADGQLGAIIRMYREWRISGDTAWIKRWWPRVRASLDYCIRTWDPAHRGWIEEPHLTTYDAYLWGADSYCASLYLGALKAATLMGRALADSTELYAELLRRATEQLHTQLFNGEYFFQHTQWTGLRASFPTNNDWNTAPYEQFPEWPALRDREGPPSQYGTGCLAAGVMGMWLGWACGLPNPPDEHKTASHLTAVHRHNLKGDLTTHANFAAPALACNNETGLVVCSWPKGGRPSIAMAYSDTVWTGIEYQVASHLIALGKIDSGLEVVRAVRRRYDGRVRNPFCEIEAGYWYARAMSSYALLQAFSGARYDAVDKILYLSPAIKGDFRCFLCTGTGYGTVGVKAGMPFLEVVSGTIAFKKIQYTEAT